MGVVYCRIPSVRARISSLASSSQTSANMSPHSDAPSPAGSFTSSHFRTAMAVQSPPYHSIYNDGFETSSVESHDLAIRRSLLPGIHVPTPAFFDPITEDLDLKTIREHAVRLAEAVVQGLTTQGSNGEAVHMSHKERNLVTTTTRKALNDAGFGWMPIIVGCGAQSTRETVMSFFQDVASASPIPILIYNYPPAAGGIDLS